MMPSSDRRLIEIWSQKKLDNEVIWPNERKVFLKLLEIAKSSHRVLEVGVGEGRIVKLLKECGVSSDFYCLDITERVRQSLGHRFLADARSLPFDEETFDLVYSLGVVEHFDQTGKAVAEHARVARRGGYVLVAVPRHSLLGVYKRVKFLIGKLMRKWKGDFMAYVGRHLTLAEVEEYFREAGLKILILEAVPPITPLGESLDRYLQKIFPPGRFGGFLYCLGQKQ
mgnify:CR=1 FL=1